MAQIIPAILEKNIDILLTKQLEISKIPDLRKIQIDFSDGRFTPNKTVAVSELPVLNPLIDWEAHLMVQDPQSYFFDLKLLGFRTVIFHFEAVEEEEIEPLTKQLRDLKISPGLALNPETSLDQTANYLGFFDEVLLMGVNPGYQGKELLPETAERVKKLKNLNKNLIIEVDGGVNLSNYKALLQSGADALVIGSALYADNLSPQQNYEKFV